MCIRDRYQRRVHGEKLSKIWEMKTLVCIVSIALLFSAAQASTFMLQQNSTEYRFFISSNETLERGKAIVSSKGRYLFGLDDGCVAGILDTSKSEVLWSQDLKYTGGPCYVYTDKGVVYHKAGQTNKALLNAKNRNALYYHLVITNDANLELYGVSKVWISDFQ
eukprot:TRINITY_DN1669_c0_g1_i2.p1 TRINITY_DN1669_c0_g1~~TRINITY_DN1669_c0_g1_i2.p1  ORF type:complete len:180 (-),score=49.06 TRINITY_DN1669_c0_g1_i2:125-616(-)